jgi:hypothetical protein
MLEDPVTTGYQSGLELVHPYRNTLPSVEGINHRLPYKRQNFINKLFASKRETSTSTITYFFTCENYPLSLSQDTS